MINVFILLCSLYIFIFQTGKRKHYNWDKLNSGFLTWSVGGPVLLQMVQWVARGQSGGPGLGRRHLQKGKTPKEWQLPCSGESHAWPNETGNAYTTTKEKRRNLGHKHVNPRCEESANKHWFARNILFSFSIFWQNIQHFEADVLCLPHHHGTEIMSSLTRWG